MGEVTTSLWLSLGWVDSNLMWQPSRYNNLSTLSLPSDRIWTPDIKFYNGFVNNNECPLSTHAFALIPVLENIFHQFHLFQIIASSVECMDMLEDSRYSLHSHFNRSTRPAGFDMNKLNKHWR